MSGDRDRDTLRALSLRGEARGAGAVQAAAQRGATRARRAQWLLAAFTLVAGAVALVALTADDEPTGRVETADDPQTVDPPPTSPPRSTAPTTTTSAPPPTTAAPAIDCAVDGTVDPAVAVLAAAAFDGWLDTQPRDEAGPFIEDWDEIREAVLDAAEAAPLPLDAYDGTVDEVLSTDDEAACVRFAILNAGQTVYEAVGVAVLVDGSWKVSRSTVCAAIAVGTERCPGDDTQAPPGIWTRVPATACPALVGPNPWITLFHTEPFHPCVRVGEHQRIRVFNKGFDEPLLVDWPSGPLSLDSDDFHDSFPAAQLFGEGCTQVESDPYAMPLICLVPERDSVAAGVAFTSTTFGPVEAGMTLAEANAALADGSPPIAVRPDLLPGPEEWAAVLEGDPYSPLFLVVGDGSDASVIRKIQENR